MSDTEEVAAVEEVAEMSVLDALREVRFNIAEKNGFVQPTLLSIFRFGNRSSVSG